MEYERPRNRARSFGVGLLSGNLLGQEGALEQFQENISFRIQSAREMIMGGSSESSFSPLERRQQIRERRLSLLNMASAGASKGDSSTSGRTRSSSGRISTNRSRGDSSSGSSSRSKSSGVPSMSEVDKGTKQRAMERGYVD